MRAILDPAALRLAGIPGPERLQRLRDINQELAHAVTAAEAVRLDDEWHFELLGECTNKILLGYIAQVTWRTRRYELGLMRRPPNVRRSTREHRKILSALKAGALEDACHQLSANMSSGKEPILAWLRERERGP